MVGVILVALLQLVGTPNQQGYAAAATLKSAANRLRSLEISRGAPPFNDDNAKWDNETDKLEHIVLGYVVVPIYDLLSTDAGYKPNVPVLQRRIAKAIADCRSIVAQLPADRTTPEVEAIRNLEFAFVQVEKLPQMRRRTGRR